MENNEIVNTTKETVNTTKETVLTAYKNGNNEVKAALKNMFPNVFEEDKYFDLERLCGPIKQTLFDTDLSRDAGFFGSGFMLVRNEFEYKGKAFYLSNDYDWDLRFDSSHTLCLIPTKKQ